MGEPLDVLLVTAAYMPQRIDGTVLTAWHLARCFAAEGLRVGIACRDLEEDGEGTREDAVDGIPVHRLSLPAPATLEKTYDRPGAAARFAELLDRLRPRLVHFHHLEHLSPALPGLCLERGLPTVATLHDYFLACPTVQLVGNHGRLCPGPAGGRRCPGCRPLRFQLHHQLGNRPAPTARTLVADAVLRRDRAALRRRHRRLAPLWRDARLRFVSLRDDRGPGLVGIDLAVRDAQAILAAARARGLEVQDAQVTICGTRFRLVRL